MKWQVKNTILFNLRSQLNSELANLSIIDNRQRTHYKAPPRLRNGFVDSAAKIDSQSFYSLLSPIYSLTRGEGGNASILSLSIQITHQTAQRAAPSPAERVRGFSRQN